MKLATFENCRNTAVTMVEVADWSEFVLHLADLPKVPADKFSKLNSTPAISPAIYEPGATRLDANVRGWSSWMGIDIDNDLIVTPIDEAEEVMRALDLPYVIYTTTKATEAKPRYRVLFEISRPLAVAEIKIAWTAMAAYFGGLGPDPACKDLSRLYMAPAIWLPGRVGQPDANLAPLNDFRFSLTGTPLDIDMVMEEHPPQPEPEPVISPALFAPKLREIVYPKHTKRLPHSGSIHNSPVVKSAFVEAYLALRKGEHHVGMFKFLCSILGRAKALGYEVQDHELMQFAREVDQISFIKTASDRWKRMPYEITRARNFIG